VGWRRQEIFGTVGLAAMTFSNAGREAVEMGEQQSQFFFMGCGKRFVERKASKWACTFSAQTEKARRGVGETARNL